MTDRLRDKIDTPERQILDTGRLFVVTGLSGSGKDTALDQLMLDKAVAQLGYQRLVTCNDRDPRPDEINHVHYHFVEAGRLKTMYTEGQLVERPLLYGSSYKATPKSEFHEVLFEGKRKVWRIDPSLAAQVATGQFFDEQFNPTESAYLKQAAAVVFITAPIETIVRRRIGRDGAKYSAAEYSLRDEQDRKILELHGHDFSHIIQNLDGQLGQTVSEMLSVLRSLHLNEIGETNY